jgi:hypothetical protein
MRQHHQGKGVGFAFQRRHVRFVVQQLGCAEAQHQLRAQQLILSLLPLYTPRLFLPTGWAI